MINCLKFIKTSLFFSVLFYCSSPILSFADDFNFDFRGKRIVHASQFGFGTDNFELDDKFQKLLDELSNVVLIIPPGVYRQHECLTIKNNGIYLIGYGVLVDQLNPESQCWVISGDDGGFIGFRLQGRGGQRGNSTKETAILIKGKNILIMGNHITKSKSAAIWVQGAKNYNISGNYISDNYSDGIHQTEGSSNGLVRHNQTNNTGDDGISVVSYSSSGMVHDVVIENNYVSNVKWARGISVIGGENIEIRSNFVNGTGRAAGIIISREESFNTRGVNNVVVEGNVISGVARIKGSDINNQTYQAAIDVNAHDLSAAGISNVKIFNNKIIDPGYSAIRIIGKFCNVEVNDVQVIPYEMIFFDNVLCRRGGS